MKKLVFSTALVLSLGLVGCSEKTTNEEAQKDEKPIAEIPIEEASNKETSSLGVNEDGKVTEEEYKQIKFGMTPEEVFNIIGSEGTVVSKSGTDGDSHNTVIYKFETEGDSSSSEMTFVRDKLSYKAQIGLETSEIEKNLEQLNKLEKGMSKGRVFEILGGKGALIAESEFLEIYSYNNPISDAVVTLSFIEGKFKSTGELKGSM
ncbi:hypothetical protein [Solibacillus cecembensis]|uniref:hypothetical protein n=1 Tax=Solibacillus cecembensis TaxID=459347 RepID=UPI000716EA16